VSGNTIGTATANSGASQSSLIRVEDHAPSGDLTASVTNNVVQSWNNGPAINFQAGDTNNVDASLDVTVTGNTISNPGANTQHGIVVNAGADINGTNLVCTDIKTNDVNLGATPPNGGSAIRERQRNGSTVKLPGYVGANTDTAAVISFLSGQNTIHGAPVTATVAVPPGGGFIGGTCKTPTPPT
jgi:hypothetical protein